MATVTFDHVQLTYPGAAAPTVRDLDLDIADGEFLVLVGPSGCGKSTTLRMLAGLEEVSAGRILIDGVDVTAAEPRERDIAMVFQNYALYPHMSVRQNMGYGLKLAGVGRAEIRRRVADTAAMLGLSGLLDRKPRDLSGGQRQRVAMGRAIVREPKVFLMDEPLSNLDAKLRVQTRAQVATLQRDLGVTTVYVTHDQVEAMTMGDRVAVLDGGVLQQVAPPKELYARPGNVFVAGFIGSPAMNLRPARVAGGAVAFGGQRIPLPAGAAPAEGAEVVLGVRPEDARLGAGGLDAEVVLVEELGADSYVYARALGDPAAAEPAIARVGAAAPPAPGTRVSLVADPARIHLFDAGDGRRLN
ncbi:sugar ABC transporter ATP-binding protein [Corynebacterium sphenisci DSM 44792]|uniref:Trehalose import ATP-binding protein SugC n=1 Tax=Corynebacterium sphenisci DSM 44792 TaxID=1437874 RepID=A0A1L7CZA4_9CORY|nr:sn-glycerol-3-phosphate ABC transporter ATP-binding protein UgpC [Corynebacterium sphenisci]APT91215.1 sugar ABC transporter ATP-binding protein [Corynebacterium sphenisci DSM 44792]